MTEQISALQKIIDTLINFFVNYSFQVFGALIILFGGFAISRWVGQIVQKLCEKKGLDIILSRFIASTSKIVIFAFAAIIALGNFGVTIAPFIAALGAVAFGATYALQGPLSNYCAGLTIILGRPFTVGDTITVVGQSGIVKEVKIGTTVLTDEDGVEITIPNKHIVGEILHNSKTNRVVESVIGISYSNSPEKAIAIIKEILARTPEVTKKPQPQVGIQEFADSSINIAYRYWVPTAKLVQVTHVVNLAIYKAFQTENIVIPFPQQEIRILSSAADQPFTPSRT